VDAGCGGLYRHASGKLPSWTSSKGRFVRRWAQSPITVLMAIRSVDILWTVLEVSHSSHYRDCRECGRQCRHGAACDPADLAVCAGAQRARPGAYPSTECIRNVADFNALTAPSQDWFSDLSREPARDRPSYLPSCVCRIGWRLAHGSLAFCASSNLKRALLFTAVLALHDPEPCCSWARWGTAGVGGLPKIRLEALNGRIAPMAVVPGRLAVAQMQMLAQVWW